MAGGSAKEDLVVLIEKLLGAAKRSDAHLLAACGGMGKLVRDVEGMGVCDASVPD